MGQRKDQSWPGETRRPPPLPPRASSPQLSPYDHMPPSYAIATSGYHSQPLTHTWSEQDPRAKSTDSLVPSRHRDGRRKLLLIYIHGFLGNETSFRSFPAHIHNLVTEKLIATHVVHTKIYPKYKSRKAIEYARDDFSNWLCPHESLETDVILVGHSMGGILSAEVALLQPYSAASREPFRHRILGTISFDTPFLGMHPGVITSGISSLFRPPSPGNVKGQDFQGKGVAIVPMTPNRNRTSDSTESAMQSPAPQESIASGYFPSQRQSNQAPSIGGSSLNPFSPLDTPIDDPNYDPPFPNDIRMPVRTSWDNALHFLMKHSDGLTKATKSYVTSHLEFGGTLADYKALKDRYHKIRSLEDVDELKESQVHIQRPPRRIRFVNYYTASTGRIPRPKSPVGMGRVKQLRQTDGGEDGGTGQEMQDMSLVATGSRSPSRSPRISVENPRGETVDGHTVREGSVGSRSPSRSPRISIENPRGRVVAIMSPDQGDAASLSQYDSCEEDANGSFSEKETAPGGAEHLADNETMNHVDPGPMTDDEDFGTDGASKSKMSPVAPTSPSAKITPSSTFSPPERAPTLPPIPSEPTPPSPFDPTPYTDKDTRKLAEKEHSRRTKAYQNALKDREKAIKDRRKLLERREKAARQAREKEIKREEKLRQKEEKAELKRQSAAASKSPEAQRLAPPPSDAAPDPAPTPDDSTTMAASNIHPFATPASALVAPHVHNKLAKKPRDRKFCVLPAKDVNGARDPCWVRVFMVGVDEVGAHTGLFFQEKEHYEELVADVGGRVQDWVREAETVRDEVERREAGG